jgi:molybdate transport system permease protein
MLKPRGDRLFYIVMVSTLLVFAAFLLVLILSTVAYVKWDRAGEIILSDEILFALRLSLVTATAASLLAMVVSVPVALALSRFDFPGKDWIDVLLDLPIILSPVAVGALLLIFFNNTAPGRFIETNIIEFSFQVPGIILAQFIVVTALAVRLLKSTFDGIDTRYENVIRTLGASRIKAVVYVVLPMAKPGIVAALVLTWARAVGEFGASVTLAGAAAFKTETLPVAIFLSFAKADVQQALVVVLCLLAIALLVLLVIRKLGRRLAYFDKN